MNAPRRSALILGSTGRLGQAVVAAFAGAGWTVLAQSRQAVRGALPAGARALQADLADGAGIARQAAGAQVVVHAANLRYRDWESGALPLARAGLAVAERLGALFVLPGNVYNFGRDMPALLAEDTPQRPSTGKGRVRCAIEEAMRERAARGQRCAVIRAGDFFGAGSGSWLDLAIARSLPRGRLVYPGPTDRVHAWAYLPDLARAFVALAEAPRGPDFECLHFAGHAVTGSDFLAALEQAAARLGLRPEAGFTRAAMPWWFIRAGALVQPDWRGLLEMRYLMEVPHALDGHALAARLGTLPQTPLVDALAQSLAALGLGAPRQAQARAA